jgi:hypothetical protein
VPRIVGCSFSEAPFTADGAAARTVAFLKAMASAGSGLQTVVRETFKAVFCHSHGMAGPPPPPLHQLRSVVHPPITGHICSVPAGDGCSSDAGSRSTSPSQAGRSAGSKISGMRSCSSAIWALAAVVTTAKRPDYDLRCYRRCYLRTTSRMTPRPAVWDPSMEHRVAFLANPRYLPPVGCNLAGVLFLASGAAPGASCIQARPPDFNNNNQRSAEFLNASE